MNKSIFLLLTIAMLLCGCTVSPAQTSAASTEPTTTVTAVTAPTAQDMPDPRASYEDAVSALNARSDLQLHMQISREVTAGNEVFTSSSQQSVTLQNRKAGQLRARITETATYGDYTTDISEIYIDGTAYSTVYGCNFSCEMTGDEFTARYLPVILLEAANYETVVWEDRQMLSFSNATMPEDWLPEEAETLIYAEGTATLDSSGNLTAVSFDTAYRCSGVTVSIQVAQTLKSSDDTVITAPIDPSAYTPITCLDIPKRMEQSYGYLLQADTVTVTTQKSSVSQAAGIALNQQIDINTYGLEMFQVEQSVYQTDYTGESYTENFLELFQDGTYTASSNGGAPEPNTLITAAGMQEYVQTYLFSLIPDLRYLAEARCTDLGSCLLIEYTGTEALAQIYCQETNQLLFSDENFLDNMASDSETLALDAYLAIDKYTGLPTAAGISYVGSHNINGISYLLTAQSDQSLDLASLDSHEAITNLSSPDTPPEIPAAPLFYRVTGTNGQLMWLLGTIHIGDSRTGYLPQQIYDAFDSSDALAVEFDTEAFDAIAKKDTSLQSSISDAYYYSDGTTAADHIKDSELYAHALKLMKASGNYNSNTVCLKPSIWSSAIDNFHLRLGRSLASDKGVDTRLLKLAKTQNKKILEIESGIFQIRMLSGWSDALQEALLSESVSASAVEYNQSIEELYELWCAGDEGSLKEALKDDTAQFTSEEKALYNEYNNAISTDRNASMLEAAKEYLESGDTVFYAVGLAHILAEDGLVNTLRSAGYTVEPVSYP